MTHLRLYELIPLFHQFIIAIISPMRTPLLQGQSPPREIENPKEPSEEERKAQHVVTFRECLQLSNGNRLYQNKLFVLMAAYWIFASFFVSLEFFLFKKPQYCTVISEGLRHCCTEGDDHCAQEVCRRFAGSIAEHVVKENSLTYHFGLFCGTGMEWLRIVLKILPEAASIIGMLIYGAVADVKGRKTAIKISWRMYTFGVVIFSTTLTMPLRIFGYVIACIHCYPSLIFQFTLLFELNQQQSRNRSTFLLLACVFVGPLFLSLTSQFLLQFDTRAMLIVLCAIPALVLSFLTNYLIQSPIYAYPYDKIKAFNIVNQIAKKNKQLPILIDLSRSHWHRHNISQQNFLYHLKKSRLILKLLVGIFFMFTIYFTIKLAQVSLDPYTDVFDRSIYMDVPTALADVSLCLFLLRFKKRSCRVMLFANCLLIVGLIVLHDLGVKHKFLWIAIAVVLRFLSQLCYGIILIWAIETFPTVNRSYCAGAVISGSSLGVIAAYGTRSSNIQLLSGALACTLLALALEGYLGLNSQSKMVDTYKGQHYDEHDSFYKF